MTDAELIARLHEAVLSKAAYEGVSSLLLSVQQDCIKERQRAERLEAKLAKAVEAVRWCRVWVENAANGDHPRPELAADDLRTLDAILKGENHD